MAMTIYATADDLRTYATQRGVSLLTSEGAILTNEQLQVFITKAQDYIDTNFPFVGEAVYDDSQFPRTGLEKYDETTIPPSVRTSTLYVASHLVEGLPILEGQRPQSEIKREVVAANRIETEYATNYKDNGIQRAIILDAPLYMMQRAGLIGGFATGINLIGLRG